MVTVAQGPNSLKSQHQHLQSSIAMTIVMISWVMFFATLFLAYGIYRFTSEVWPPMGMEKTPLGLPTLSTVFILLSSLTFIFFENNYLKKNYQSIKYSIFATLALGLGFLFTQWQLWQSLKLAGVYVESGIFASLIFGFTWIHAAHIILGLVGLGWVVANLKKISLLAERSLLVKNVGIFWHFLGVIWVLMYFALFVF